MNHATHHETNDQMKTGSSAIHHLPFATGHFNEKCQIPNGKWKMLLGLRSFFVLAAIALVFIGVLPLPGYSAPAQEPEFRPGLRTSRNHPLSPKQLRTLLEGLRLKTGFVEMGFAQDGSLTLGDRTHVVGGSATARKLIIAAVDSRDSFNLENHNQSPAIAFAQVAATIDYVDAAGINHEVWDLRLDFHDFGQLRGSADAFAAFDPAMNLLHELGHAVLKLHDTITQVDPLGNCERHINRVRRELGLPERQHYQPQARLDVMPDRLAVRFQAQLNFVQTGADNRIKKSSLYFNIEGIAVASKTESESICQSQVEIAMRKSVASP